MSFCSLPFFGIVTGTLVAYYLCPLNHRWWVLLFSSLFFYYVSAGWFPLISVLLTSLFVFYMAKEVASHRDDRSKMRMVMTIAVVVLVALLTLFKTGLHKRTGVSWIVMPLGISYFTFSLIGYIADVYWKKSDPEDDYFKLVLFTVFFPKIIQGPISKYRVLSPQLVQGHRYNREAFWFGAQRVVWGFFKKIVIADRALMLKEGVFNSFASYSYGGAVLIFVTLLSVYQHYCDFSGYMDIVIGISNMMGIDLDENFRQPFLSKSAAEFWRRWHMSLGEWFKDYVYMPLMISPKLIQLSGKVRNRFSKRAGKAVMTVIPLMAVWTLTGLWHGTGADYIAWGLYWGLIITLSNLFAPEIKKASVWLHIPAKSKLWGAVQTVRTFLIFTIGFLVSTLVGLGGIKQYIWQILHFKAFNLNYRVFSALGMTAGDLNLLVFSVLGLVLIELMQARGIHIRKTISSWPCIVRWTIYALGLLVVVLFGVYGPGYTTRGFAYAVF